MNDERMRQYYSSVRPGHRVVCGPSGEVGYIAKKPGHGAATQALLDLRDKNRIKALNTQKKQLEAIQNNYMINYRGKFDLLTVRSAVNRLVELGLEEADRDLDKKRNRLKVALLEEDSKNVEEYTEKAQKFQMESIEKSRKLAETAAKQADITDRLKAQLIYDQRELARSDAYKEKMRLDNIRDLSIAYQAQLDEKDREKFLDDEDDKLWNDIWNEDCRQTMIANQKAKDLAEENMKVYQQILQEQTDERKRIEVEDLRREECEDSRRAVIQQQWASEMELRAERAKINRRIQASVVADQIEAKRAEQEKTKHDELASEIELEKNRLKVESQQKKETLYEKERAWRELALFKDAVHQYRGETAAADAEVDRAIHDQKMATRKKEIEVLKAKNKARKEGIAADVETLKLMAARKIAKEKKEKEADPTIYGLPTITMEAHDRLDDRCNKVPCRKVDVLLHNEQCEKYVDLLRQREDLWDEELIQRMRQKSEETLQRLQENIGPLSDLLPQHPFAREYRRRRPAD